VRFSSAGKGWRERFAAVTLGALVLGAILVPVLAQSDPRAIGDVITLRLLAPLSVDPGGHLHVLGTDAFGRDIFARMMLAARVSLTVGVAGSVLAGLVGIVVGASAAWLGGATDRLAMGVSDALLAIPRLVLLLVCASLWPPGVTMVIVVLMATGWMGVARLVRAEALGVGSAILLESGLSFLGLGIQPPRPSWGNMISDGRETIVMAPWVALAPGLALIVTVLACTLLGDALRDRLAGEEVLTMRGRS
jgi:peptide/nickel transport system permease protein